MNIVLLSGSRRQASLNFLLLKIVAQQLQEMAITPKLIAPSTLDAPLYDGDYEQQAGIPASIKVLNSALAGADGLIVASPEYNGFFSPLLKNTLDWMSRAEDGQPGMALFKDKPALALAASPGAMAGVRALLHVRTLLSNLGCNVFRSEFGIGRAGTVLSEEGTISDAKIAARLTAVVTDFIAFVRKLNH